MNLTKLFNKNYLIQNLKKSRTLLLLTLFIVPVLNFLILLNVNSNYITTNIMHVANIVNTVGMYIIPVAISYILFGYVFKRKSVDFIGSMPINRKTIFTTNLIGGILLIFAIQLLNFLTALFASMCFNGLVLPISMLIDYFIFGMVSYIFVYTATNIGMAISGNLLTQIAITLLILFLVPFTIDVVGNFDITKTIQFAKDDANISVNIEVENNYTLPYGYLKGLIIQNPTLYSNGSLVRTIVMAVVYAIIGYLLFEKRKMENTEEAFQNVWVHLFIKGLTLVPMIAILVKLEESIKITALILAFIFIYYYVYDLVTRRKVKLKLEIPAFILTVAVLFGCFKISNDYFSEQSNDWKTYSKEDIKSLGFFILNPTDTKKSGFNSEEIKYEFTDSEIIDEFYEGLFADEYLNYYARTVIGNKDTEYVYVKIRLKDGQEITKNIRLVSKNASMLKWKIIQNEEYMKMVKADFEYGIASDSVMIFQNKKVKGTEKNNIKNILNNLVDNNFSSIVNNNNTKTFIENEIDCYYYKNHRLHKRKVLATTSDELKAYLANYSNRLAKANIILDEDDGNHITNALVFESSSSKYVFMNSFGDIKNFVKNSSENVDLTKDYLKISISQYKNDNDSEQLYFYSNDVEKYDEWKAKNDEYGDIYTIDNSPDLDEDFTKYNADDIEVSGDEEDSIDADINKVTVTTDI